MLPNIELAKEAYAIVAGIPDECVNLGQWCAQEGRSLDNGTVCCPATWLTKHPRFRALGLFDDGRGRPALGDYRGYAALGALFKIDTETAKMIFCPANTPAWRKVSDKETWLTRMGAFLDKWEPRRRP